MKALTISAHGGLDQVMYRDDVAIPELRAPADVRIRLAAAALKDEALVIVAEQPRAVVPAPGPPPAPASASSPSPASRGSA